MAVERFPVLELHQLQRKTKESAWGSCMRPRDEREKRVGTDHGFVLSGIEEGEGELKGGEVRKEKEKGQLDSTVASFKLL